MVSAVLTGDVNKTQYYLDQGQSLNLKHEDTALIIIAASCLDVDIVMKLLNHSADAHSEDSDGKSIFCYFFDKRDLGLCKQLLSAVTLDEYVLSKITAKVKSSMMAREQTIILKPHINLDRIPGLKDEVTKLLGCLDKTSQEEISRHLLAIEDLDKKR